MRNKIRLLSIAFMVICNAKFNVAFGQVSTGTNAISAGQYVGSSTSVDVDNVTQQNQNINFFTNGGTTYPWANQRMTILSTGEVGIGTIAPLRALEVNNDINLTSSVLNNGYRIEDSVVLQKPLVGNLFVGAGAGISLTGGTQNVLVGTEAGNSIQLADGNVFVGYQAGYSAVNAHDNTFVGWYAGRLTTSAHNSFFGDASGRNNTTGTYNTFMGGHCATNNVTGNYSAFVGAQAGLNSNADNNSFFGHNTGYLTTTGPHNSFFGKESGFSNTVGAHNSFFGHLAGYANTTGDENTIIGSQADVGANNLNNATAIGSYAVVMHNSEMILGTNAVNVGIGLSGNTTGPRWKLETNDGNPGFSGLGFRQLNSTSTANLYPAYGKVLTVNGQGEVVLTDDIGYAGAFNGTSVDASTMMIQLGQDAIGGSGADLQIDRDIPMNNYDIYFTEPLTPGGVKNNIGMGIATNPRTRLNVDKTTLSGLQMAVAGGFSASTVTGNALDVAYGVWCTADNTSHSTSFELAGGKFSANGTTIAGTYAVHGYGVRPDLAGPVWGGYFEAVGAPGGPMPPVAFAYGVEGRAQAKVLGTAHYAVYGNLGVACPTWPPVACPTAATFDYAGYFNGDVLSTTNIFLASDANLKENIQDITNPMDIITQLNPKSYTFKRDQNPSMQLSDSTHFGILAQELEGLLPQLVKNTIHPPVTDSVGNIIYAPVDFKAVNYIELIPFLISGMKQQQQTIESMQTQLDNCCNAGNRHSNPNEGEQGNSTSIDVELQNAKSIILNQNAPNPFAEQTTITYFLTDDVKKAQMFFYDNKGTILKTVEINEKGTGQINVFAADLSSGNYTYSLVADGKVIDTKKMVKTN